MYITKNNYIKPIGTAGTFRIEIKGLSPCENYYLESIKAAKEIESLRQGRLYIFYSGGVDSEYVVALFYSLKINFTPVIIRFTKKLNKHDVDYALEFCKSINLQPIIIDIDFAKFVKQGKMFDLSLSMKSSIPHYSTTAYGILQLDGTIICAGFEPYIGYIPMSNQWAVKIYQYEFSLVNLFKDHNIIGTPYFNGYTSGMMRSFLEDNRMVDLASNKVYGKLGSHSSKFLIYNRHSNFNLKERQKYHGLEKVEKTKIFQDDSFKELEKQGQCWNGVWEKEYFQFIKEKFL
jgi:hypothetical protein